jgi:hypothetical protein
LEYAPKRKRRIRSDRLQHVTSTTPLKKGMRWNHTDTCVATDAYRGATRGARRSA